MCDGLLELREDRLVGNRAIEVGTETVAACEKPPYCLPRTADGFGLRLRNASTSETAPGRKSRVCACEWGCRSVEYGPARPRLRTAA